MISLLIQRYSNDTCIYQAHPTTETIQKIKKQIHFNIPDKKERKQNRITYEYNNKCARKHKTRALESEKEWQCTFGWRLEMLPSRFRGAVLLKDQCWGGQYWACGGVCGKGGDTPGLSAHMTWLISLIPLNIHDTLKGLNYIDLQYWKDAKYDCSIPPLTSNFLKQTNKPHRFMECPLCARTYIRYSTYIISNSYLTLA